MFKLLPLLFLCTLLFNASTVVADQNYCISCQKQKSFRCTFEAKTKIGPKPGRFFCTTYLSEATGGSCSSTPYRFLKCGIRPHLVIKAGEYSDRELKTLKLTHLRSLLYLTAKGVVNLLEYTKSGQVSASQALSPALDKASGLLDNPLNQAKRASKNLMKKGETALDQASKSVQQAKDSAQDKLQEAQDKATTGFEKARDSAKEQINAVKDKASALQ